MHANTSLGEPNAVELIRKIEISATHLFSLKERQRIMLGEYFNSCVHSVTSPHDDITHYALTYRLDIGGDLSGAIYLNLDKKLAQEIAVKLVADESALLPEDIETAMHELLNIFAGHLSTALYEFGLDTEISSPVSTEENFLTMGGRPCILFRFRFAGQVLQFALRSDGLTISHIISIGK